MQRAQRLARLLVEVEHLRGFVPQSHIAVRVPNREDLVGQTIPVKFLEVDEEKNRLVMSNRLATDVVSGEGLGVGDVCSGVVQAVKPYGAFVDVGGVSGLLHISQISYDRIEDLSSVVELNSLIKCMIIDHDKVNVNGGAIAIGHPIGASGARILTTLLLEMKRSGAKKGLATLCIGGGMGVAMCVERG